MRDKNSSYARFRFPAAKDEGISNRNSCRDSSTILLAWTGTRRRDFRSTLTGVANTKIQFRPTLDTNGTRDCFLSRDKRGLSARIHVALFLHPGTRSLSPQPQARNNRTRVSESYAAATTTPSTRRLFHKAWPCTARELLRPVVMTVETSRRRVTMGLIDKRRRDTQYDAIAITHHTCTYRRKFRAK